MKKLRILFFFLAWAGVSSPAASVYAQNPPFKNPSLDSNCYFPQIGDPSEMDTIVGSVPNQELGGSVLKNLGPKPDGSFGNMLIGNISPSVALAQVATGPGFNLHNIQRSIQSLNPDVLIGGSDAYGFRLGHFRDRSHLDLFVRPWRIYWADDEGNYDTTRFTLLAPNIRAGNFKSDGGIGRDLMQPYFAHLTSDTVDDIVVSAYTDNEDTVPPYTRHDTAYVLLYRGGVNLYGKDTVSEDTSALLYPMGPNSPMLSCTQADFRGVGRDDLIVSHFGISTYYRNDAPFTIQKFVEEIAKDTLSTDGLVSITPNGYAAEPDYLPMPAVPKKSGNHSLDLIAVGASDTSETSIYFFQGGASFGSHKIGLDSAAFVITHPDYGFGSTSYGDWPQSIADAGDMTGTGNHVLFTTARNDYGDYWWDVSYVTGKALDNKIDIWNSAPYSVSPGDTLTANGDSLEDYLFSRSWPYAPNGPEGAGSLWLYYGSKNIPVHLDSQWADVKNIPTQNGVAFTLSPNPTRLWSVATIVWPEAEEAGYEVYNLLGEVVQSGTIRMLGGAEQERIYFPNLASGVYEVLIHGTSHEARAKLFIVR